MTKPIFSFVELPSPSPEAKALALRMLKDKQASDRDPRKDPMSGDIIAVGGRRCKVDFVKEGIVWAHWCDSFGAFHANLELWRDWSRGAHVVKVAIDKETTAPKGHKPLAHGQKIWIAAGGSADGGMPQFLVMTKEADFDRLAKKNEKQAADYFDKLCNRKGAITFDTFRQVYDYLRASDAVVADEFSLMADL